eukprot:SAG31_NODE_46979_length_252_cov_0.673203_1_plen_58_part_10
MRTVLQLRRLDVVIVLKHIAVDYPYTWDEAAISNPGPGTVTFGSGSSGGQARFYTANA